MKEFSQTLFNFCERPHWKCSYAYKLWRHSAEFKILSFERDQIRHVFSDKDFVFEKDGMNGPSVGASVIDIVAVNSN